MARLTKRIFMHFAVALPEAGDTAAMQQLLDAHPEHADELLFGERPGVDEGRYSVWGYSTWLCQFDAYRDGTRPVVEWLIAHGHEVDLWSAIALDDAAALEGLLADDSELAQARHPLFNDSALVLASPALRPLLLAHGADDGSISTALLLGDTERALEMIDDDPTLVEDPLVGRKTLMAALTNGHDHFACELIARGVDTAAVDGEYAPLSMAATWGNPAATTALIEAGADPNRRDGIFTPLSMCVSRSVAPADLVADVVANLLAGGAEVRRTKIEGRTLLQWCDAKGFDRVAGLLKEAASRARGSSRKD